MKRRYLALWFPWLPAERLARAGRTGSPERPLVIAEPVKGALRLAAADRHAEALGLLPGLPLANARARVAGLVVEEHDAPADRRLLERLADLCIRYTPMVALDLPDTLILDIAGAAHLFGGEDGLVSAARARLRRHGFSVCTAFADTPDAARAFAHFGTDTFDALPVAALRLGEERETALRRAGLYTVGDLACRPLSGLAARFGAEAATAVRRMTGEAESPIAPRRVLPPVEVERRFPEPVARTDYVLGVLADLLAEACRILEARGEGGRRFEAVFFRSDGKEQEVFVQTGTPVRHAAPVVTLFAHSLARLEDPLDPGFGFDAVRLAVPVTEPLAPGQPDLDRAPPPGPALDALVDRLAARLGPERLLRFHPCNSHVPERAARLRPGIPSGDWPVPPPDDPPLRPLALLRPPRLLSNVVADVPDGPPRRFRLGLHFVHIVRAEGPERIAAEWWRRPGLTRDYYRVEDETGRRLWIFRHGLYDREETNPRWYLHGLFA
ncbi:MAG: DNA polymerase Y family protein [Sphingosinicella sp.]|nr:DNA polymerase Y family protein [Sphingosinicella sp.]